MEKVRGTHKLQQQPMRLYQITAKQNSLPDQVLNQFIQCMAIISGFFLTMCLIYHHCGFCSHTQLLIVFI